MPQHGSQVIRRGPDYDSIDKFFTAVAISFLLHLIALTVFYIYSSITLSAMRKLPEPEAYVVHLVDPGPLTTIMKPEAGKRSELMVRKEKELLKGVLTPYKLAPVTKKVEVAGKKVMVEQKAVKRQAKIEEKSAVMYRKVIKGGTVDIRKFPYEWYLRSMEDKIYRNWDTLSTNFFIDRPLNVTVYFVVDRKGMVGEVYVEESSLNDAVDISAMEAVKLSSPLPPLPAGYEEDILEVHFGFRLEAFR